MNRENETRWPLLTLVVCGVAILLQATPNLLDAFTYDRTAIAAGEVWRLATGHLTHWNASHLVWDTLMFAVLGVVLERRSRREWLTVVGLSTAAISAWLWFWQVEIEAYRGLSGLDSALFVAVSAGVIRDAHSRSQPVLVAIGVAALAAFAGKISYEVATGSTLFVDAPAAGFIPLAAVHAVGGICGAAAAMGRALTNGRRTLATPVTRMSFLTKGTCG